jgi:hypothetical protein
VARRASLVRFRLLLIKPRRHGSFDSGSQRILISHLYLDAGWVAIQQPPVGQKNGAGQSQASVLIWVRFFLLGYHVERLVRWLLISAIRARHIGHILAKLSKHPEPTAPLALLLLISEGVNRYLRFNRMILIHAGVQKNHQRRPKALDLGHIPDVRCA